MDITKKAAQTEYRSLSKVIYKQKTRKWIKKSSSRISRRTNKNIVMSAMKEF